MPEAGLSSGQPRPAVSRFGRACSHIGLVFHIGGAVHLLQSNLSAIYLQGRMLVAALEAAEAAIAADPSWPKGHFRRGAVLAALELRSSMAKVPPGQRPSSAPVPPQGAPGGSGQLGTPRKRPSHWTPSQCLGCSSEPPPKPRISRPLTMQVAGSGASVPTRAGAGAAERHAAQGHGMRMTCA